MLDKKVLEMQIEMEEKQKSQHVSVDDFMNTKHQTSLGSYTSDSSNQSFGAYNATSSQTSLGGYENTTTKSTIGSYDENITSSEMGAYSEKKFAETPQIVQSTYPDIQEKQMTFNQNVLESQKEYQRLIQEQQKQDATSHINPVTTSMTDYQDLSKLKWVDDVQKTGGKIANGVFQFAKQEALSGSEVGSALLAIENYTKPVASLVIHRLQAIENFGLECYQANNTKLMMARHNIIEAGGVRDMSDKTYVELSNLLSKESLNDFEKKQMDNILGQYIRQQGGSVGSKDVGLGQTKSLLKQAIKLQKQGKISSDVVDLLRISYESKKFYAIPSMRDEFVMLAGFALGEFNKAFKDNDIVQTLDFVNRIKKNALQAYKVGTGVLKNVSRVALWILKKAAILAAKTRLGQLLEEKARRMAATPTGKKVVNAGKKVKEVAKKPTKVKNKFIEYKYKYSFKEIRKRAMLKLFGKLIDKLKTSIIGKAIGAIANALRAIIGKLAAILGAVAAVLVIIIVVVAIIVALIEKFNLNNTFNSYDDPAISKGAIKAIEKTLQDEYEAEMTTYYQLAVDYDDYEVVYDNDTNRDVDLYLNQGIDVNQYVPNSNNEELVAMTMAYCNYKITSGLFGLGGNTGKATTFLGNAYRASHADYSYEKSAGGTKLTITVRPYYFDKLFDLNFTSVASGTYTYTGDQMETAQLIWDYLTELGYNDYLIAGILGNMQQESSLNPAAIECGGQYVIHNGKKMWPDLRYEYHDGHGLIQISDTNSYYTAFLAVWGEVATDPIAQVNWILTNYADLGERNGAAGKGKCGEVGLSVQDSFTSPEQAAYWWEEHVERGAMGKRIGYARNWYNLLHED